MKTSGITGSVASGLVVLAATLGATPGHAQEQALEYRDLPRHVAEQVVSFFNDSSTTRFSGRSRVPGRSVIVGDVGALGGPFTIAGRIDGDLLVVNGDVEFEPGGVVTGDVTVIGGDVLGAETGNVGGTLTVYDEALRYVHRGDRITYAGSRPRFRGVDLDEGAGYGSTRFMIRSGINYNRVEGLPVLFGPRIETEGVNPLRVEAFAIWRTDSGLRIARSELGYRLLAEQSLGGRSLGSVGFVYESSVRPIESWALSTVEASLATFLFHEDPRDYYDREGWSVFLRYRPRRQGLSAGLEYRNELHAFAPVGGPWSLKDNDAPWRSQPLVAEGRIQSVAADLTLDTRNDTDDPYDGWLIEVSARKGIEGSLEVPSHIDPFPTPPGEDPVVVPSRRVDSGFASGFVDMRRYNRVGPGSRLALRGIVGGSLNGDPLPPQFQHAVGGEGSLPGFPDFFGDCGARSTPVGIRAADGATPPNEEAFPTYGCDRIALFQAEYRSSVFGLDLGPGDEWRGWDDWGWASFDIDLSWAIFLNAGRGWALEEGTFRRDTETLVDAGFGFLLDNVGLYWAFPLAGEDRQGNFFIRLSHRF